MDTQLLFQDARNAAIILKTIHDSGDYDKLCNFMGYIVPGLRSIEHVEIAGYNHLLFHQTVDGKDTEFNVLNVSDGTLRALAILMAIYQPSHPYLILVEEPETAIHPAALNMLMQAFYEDAVAHSQVLLTSHSPDLLDFKSVKDDNILVVEVRDGKTTIQPMGEIPRSMIRDYLSTAGRLFSMDELGTDRDADIDYGELMARKYLNEETMA